MSEETTMEQPSAPPALDLNDLVLATQLIAAAIKRGAYEPSELVAVGETHGKLSAFLQYQAEQQEQKKASKEAEVDAEADAGDEE